MIMKRTNLTGFTIWVSAAAAIAVLDAAPVEKTYVGCVANASDGAYSLTHILGAGAAGARSELRLEASRVDLSKHVGEKVSVRGTEDSAANGPATLTVIFVKTLTKSCS